MNGPHNRCAKHFKQLFWWLIHLGGSLPGFLFLKYERSESSNILRLGWNNSQKNDLTKYSGSGRHVVHSQFRTDNLLSILLRFQLMGSSQFVLKHVNELFQDVVYCEVENPQIWSCSNQNPYQGKAKVVIDFLATFLRKLEPSVRPFYIQTFLQPLFGNWSLPCATSIFNFF